MALIVWDRDDVLVDLMGAWLERWWKPQHPECRATYADLTENPPHRVLGVNQEVYLQSLDEFRLSDIAANLEPVPEVAAWFQRNGHRSRHLVLTATSLESGPISAAWTFRHFGYWVRSFHLVPALRSNQSIPQYEATKGDYLRALGLGDVMVEDSSGNLAAALELGMAGVLIPRPWNGGVGSVTDALGQLDAILAQLPHSKSLL